MIQYPKNIYLVAGFSALALFAIISLGITGSLCSAGFCTTGGTVSAGPAIGVIASVFGGLISGLGKFYYFVFGKTFSKKVSRNLLANI